MGRIDQLQKKMRRGCVLGFVLIAAVVLAIYWKPLFGDLIEPAYELSNGTQRVIMSPGRNGLYERRLTWVTGGGGSKFVWVTPLDAINPMPVLQDSMDMVRNSIKTHGGVTNVHTSILYPLPAGRYAYEVNDSFGSEDNYLYRDTFEIAPYTGSTELVLIGDLQDWGSEDARAMVEHIHSLHSSAAAWLFVGDQVERPQDRFWDVFYESVSPIASRVPLVMVPGNHEYEWGLPFVLGPRYDAYTSYHDNGPDQLDRYGYYIDYPRLRVITLDTNVLYAHYGKIKKWLQMVLTERVDDPFVIVMGHHGPYSVRKGRFNPIMYWGIRPILEKYGVDLMISGHDHAYARHRVEKPTIPEARTHYITISSSGKSYPVGNPDRHHVSASGERYYQTLLVQGDTLYYRSYSPGDHLMDSLMIVK